MQKALRQKVLDWCLLFRIELYPCLSFPASVPGERGTRRQTSRPPSTCNSFGQERNYILEKKAEIILFWFYNSTDRLDKHNLVVKAGLHIKSIYSVHQVHTGMLANKTWSSNEFCTSHNAPFLIIVVPYPIPPLLTFYAAGLHGSV